MTTGIDDLEVRAGRSGEDVARRPAAPRGARAATWSSTDILLLAMVVIWGVNVSVLKRATTLADPLAFNGVRVAVAALTLSVVAGVRRAELPAWRDRVALLALGVLGCGLYQFLFIEGVARTRAGNVGLVQGAGPAFIALIAWAARVERLSRRGWAGVVLSLAGVALVTFGRTDAGTGEASVVGNLLVVLASLCWAAFAVMIKRYDGRIETLSVTAWTMGGGALALLAAGAPAILGTSWARVPRELWLWILYGGSGALGLAYLFWYRGVRVLGPSRTAMYGNLQPVIVLLVAWLWLREVPTVGQWLGTATIVAGVVLTRTGAVSAGAPAAEAVEL